MTDQHPITPPDKQLVRKWIEDWAGGQMKGPVTEDQLVVATQATQWGGDQELEACCEWLRSKDILEPAIDALRAARRPKPPSLKEQALDALGPEPQPKIGHSWDTILNCRAIERHRLVRRALEALDD